MGRIPWAPFFSCGLPFLIWLAGCVPWQGPRATEEIVVPGLGLGHHGCAANPKLLVLEILEQVLALVLLDQHL